MNSTLTHIFASFMSTDKYERRKIGLLALTFLLVIAAYTVVYDLKNSIFVAIVGKKYVPYAKLISMVVLVPAILFYSFLVDRLKRHQLLYFYSIFYALFGLICVYIMGHPTIGIANTATSPWRLFGWAFYFLVEGFPSFFVSVFWAFSNSINSPKSAKQNYGVLVSGSKLGGMISSGFTYYLLSMKDVFGKPLFSDVIGHQYVLIFFTMLSLLVSVVVYVLMKTIPENYLHGYEAVYQFEKEKDKQEDSKPGLFAGLQMMFSRPYILGIFGMLSFWEILNTILSYQRLEVAQAASTTVSEMSSLLYQQMFAMHFLGFFISLFGTSTLLKFLGERVCLLLIPLVSGVLLFYFWFTFTPTSLLVVFVTLKSINYAFATPIRESLYIPTVKDIKFKSKSWIDAFGQKIARSLGSGVNMLADKLGPVFYFPLHGAVFVSIVSAWSVTAYLLGRRYMRAVKNNEVIS